MARSEWMRDVILRELRGELGQRSISGGDSWRSLASGQRACDLSPQARDSRRKRSTNCSTRSARPSTSWPESWQLPQEGNSDGKDNVGTQGNHHLAAAQPDLYLRGGIHGARSYRTFSLLSVHLRQQPLQRFYTPTYIRSSVAEQSERAAETTTGCSWWALAEFNRVSR